MAVAARATRQSCDDNRWRRMVAVGCGQRVWDVGMLQWLGSVEGCVEDWWTVGVVPLMSKRTVGIVDGGGRRHSHGVARGRKRSLLSPRSWSRLSSSCKFNRDQVLVLVFVLKQIRARILFLVLTKTVDNFKTYLLLIWSFMKYLYSS